MTFDPLHFKKQFPLFQQAHNQHLVYLDNAATTQKPQCAIDAISHFYTTENGNAQRASHRLARAATAHIERVRQQTVDFLGASSSDEIVFTHGTTEALNVLAYSLLSTLTSADQVVLSHTEHHANLVPWQQWSSERACKLSFFPHEKALPQWDRWQEVVNERTKVLALTAASNALGVLTNLSFIKEIKQKYPEILIVVDASQVACHLPLKAIEWQCDFLVCSAHKFYGPTGVGLLYAKQEQLKKLPPLIVGGEMVKTVGFHHSQFVEGYQRFEAGTSSMAAIAGLGACLTFWQQQDRQAMIEYEQSLTCYLHDQITQCLQSHQRNHSLKLITRAADNVGMATLVSCDENYSLADLALWLDEQDIAVRVGDHCAQPLWQVLQAEFGSAKGLRISLAAYNTEKDIDRLVNAIEAFIHAIKNAPNSANVNMDALDDINWQDLLVTSSWQRRYTQLLRWGKKITTKPDIRQSQYQIKGCESEVWLVHHILDGQHYFLMDSDSTVIKGLSALLLLWFNGKTAEEIMSINVEERYQKLSLDKHLSASRMNGFKALLAAIKQSVR